MLFSIAMKWNPNIHHHENGYTKHVIVIKWNVTKRAQYKEGIQTGIYLRLGDEDKGWHKEHPLGLKLEDTKMG